MRFGPALFTVTLLLAAGCGGKDSAPTKATSEGPIGKGASGVWIYQPAGKPKDVVVYFHGQGGPEEATPANHLPWINHLVKRGSVVIYPRYEMSYEADPMQFITNAVRTAQKRVDLGGLPVLVIGYSRGGAIAVEYGAVATERKLANRARDPMGCRASKAATSAKPPECTVKETAKNIRTTHGNCNDDHRRRQATLAAVCVCDFQMSA
jgi:acetyl esterase/lipase